MHLPRPKETLIDDDNYDDLDEDYGNNRYDHEHDDDDDEYDYDVDDDDGNDGDVDASARPKATTKSVMAYK